MACQSCSCSGMNPTCRYCYGSGTFDRKPAARIVGASVSTTPRQSSWQRAERSVMELTDCARTVQRSRLYQFFERQWDQRPRRRSAARGGSPAESRQQEAGGKRW
jgi:hypothetical protein